MANRFSLVLIILLLVLKIAQQRTRKCGNIECVVEANGCKQNSAGIQVCDCFVGREGDACEIDRDECTEHGRSPCGHRGYCVNSVGSYKCDCLDGWSGMTCRTLTHPPNFDCFPGWTGRFCSYDIDECSNGTTLCPGPHEYCTNIGGGFNCTCDAGWGGSHCNQDMDECSDFDNPCGINRMCQNTIGSFECPCMTGWYGVNCDKNVDECVLKPCGTSGTCVDTNGSFVCECLSGYTGDVCEITITDDSMSPTTYAVIGCLCGFVIIIFIIAILIYCYMRSKLQDLKQSQEEAKRIKMIQDRTTKIRPFAPMFSIKRQMDSNDNNSAAAKPTQYRNKHDIDNKQRFEGRIHAVKPMDRNRDYSRSTRHHNINQTDGEDRNAENKWDHKRPRNYESPKHTGPAEMSSKNSTTAQSLSGTDVLSDNTWNNPGRPPKHFNSLSDNPSNGKTSDSSSSLTLSHNWHNDINKMSDWVTSDSRLQQTVHSQYVTDLTSDEKWKNNRQTPSYRSHNGIKPNRASSTSPLTPTVPVYYGKGLHSDNKWNSGRRTKNHNSSSDNNRSKMFSDSSFQQIIPVHYKEESVVDY